MKFNENRPFYFSVIVWATTWAIAPVFYLGERLIPGLEDPSPRIAAIREWPMLGKLYPVSLGIGFLLFGVFSFATDFFSKTKMPAWLVKAILSILAIGLIRLAFYMLGASLDEWLMLFRSYYHLALLNIWFTPLRIRVQKADITATA